jgi:F0F1-type ATP synthase membrane subunit b/b'
MPDITNPHDAPDPGSRRSWSRSEIDAAIAGLDRATRRFTGQVDAIARGASATRAAVESEMAEREAQPAPAPQSQAPRMDPLAAPRLDRPSAPRFRQLGGLDQELNAAEREAREYLAQAKRRADTLVATMIGAVEREAAELKREAEEGIRARWNAVEEEAGKYLDDARRVADGMVTERQTQLSTISDEILTSAQSVTNGLEDAARVRAQFEAFVRTLSATAARIAEESSGHTEHEVGAMDRRQSRAGDGAIAA